MEGKRIGSKKPREMKSVYSPCQITTKIALPINAVGKDIMQTIERVITSMISRKCIVQGYVKPDSIRVITFSSGLVKGDQVLFDIVYNCEVCYPVANMHLNCIARHITKAGINAESADETPSPFKLYIARDHYYDNKYFNSIEENEKFVARVVATRFELNDDYISIIAELVPQNQNQQTKKPKLIL